MELRKGSGNMNIGSNKRFQIKEVSLSGCGGVPF
jgi:hypothetical protein